MNCVQRIGSTALLVVAISLAAAAPAGAGDLVSPPNDFNWASDKALNDEVALVCAVVNAGHRTRTIRLEAKDIDGDTLSSDTREVEPGATAAIDQSSEGGSAAPRYCKFSTLGSTKSLRASACVFEQGIGCVATVAAWCGAARGLIGGWQDPGSDRREALVSVAIAASSRRRCYVPMTRSDRSACLAGRADDEAGDADHREERPEGAGHASSSSGSTCSVTDSIQLTIC